MTSIISILTFQLILLILLTSTSNQEPTEEQTESDCGTPPYLDNATVEISKAGTVNVTTYAKYTCDVGYDSSGTNNTRQCLQNGNWSALSFSCKIKDCGPPKELDNAAVETSNAGTAEVTTYQSVANYTCNVGYDPSGTNNTRHCLQNGNWSALSFSCKIRDCGPPKELDNAAVETSNAGTADVTTYQSVANYTCNVGYDPSGSNNTMHCLQDGNWSALSFSCKIRDCGPPEELDNAAVETSKAGTADVTTYQSVANYTCNVGYDPSGTNNTIHCLQDGSWSALSFSCIIREENIGQNCEIDEQCTTTNALCVDFVCNCDGNHFYLQSDNACVPRTDVDIDKMNFKLTNSDNVWSNMIRVKWTYDPDENHYDTFVVNAIPVQAGKNESSLIVKTNELNTEGEVVIRNITSLSPGTNYSVTFYTTLKGIPSMKSTTLTAHTLPSNLPGGDICNVTEHAFTVTWTDENPPSYNSYDILMPPGAKIKGLCNESTKEYYCSLARKDNFTSVVFTGLKAGHLYSVKIFTRLGDLRSKAAFKLTTYTVPLALEKINIPEMDIRSGSFVVSLDESKLEFRNWTLKVVDAKENMTVYNATFSSLEKQINVSDDNLKSGTRYYVTVTTSVPGYESRNSTTKEIYTRPALPSYMKIPETSITTNSFVVKFETNDTHFDYFLLSVCDNKHCPFNDSINGTSNQTTIENLTSGTVYNVVLYTVLQNDLKSFHSRNISKSTLSSSPTQVNVTDIHEENITINIETNDDRYDHFYVSVCLMDSSCPFDGLLFNHTVNVIENISYATLYTVNVFTVNKDGLKSNEMASKNFSTRPATPQYGFVSSVDLRSVVLDLSNNTFDNKFSITYVEGRETVNFTVKGGGPHTWETLTAGTSYEFIVHTEFSGLLSDGFILINFNTKPEQISNLLVSGVTNYSLTLEWKPPTEGNVTRYEIVFYCLGPNEDSKIVSKTADTVFSKTSYNITGLSPGTFCNATFTTYLGSEEGYPNQNLLTTGTLEEGPGVVKNIKSTEYSRRIQIEWDKPSLRNGAITKYEVTVKLGEKNVMTKSLDCSACEITNDTLDLNEIVDECSSSLRCENSTSEDSLQLNIPDLHPFRTYSFDIKAFSTKPGQSISYVASTDEDIPDGPPQNLTKMSATENTILLQWDPPSYDLRNGIITFYTIQYSFRNKTCYNSNDSNNESLKTLSTGNSTKLQLENLFPFTDYNIKIKANTSVGDGNYSKSTLISTDQSIPDKIDYAKVKTSVTNDTVQINWDTPCKTNGIIVNYTIKIRNKHKGIKEPLRIETTLSNITNEKLSDMLPYNNYTVTIIANTIKGGTTDTNGIDFTTAIGAPKVPKDVKVQNLSSTELIVSWETPVLYTGPTKYRVTATDQTEPSNVSTHIVYGFQKTSYIIKSLDEYWNYTITVTAVTDKGEATANSVTGGTDEGVPLEVESLDLLPQQNVSLERSIDVKWTPPTKRNKNGILTFYVVKYSMNDNSGVKQIKLPPNINEWTIKNIKPGNYTVVVSAATSKGNGSVTEKSANLLPGAPLKVEESITNPLMRAASLPVKNDKKEIALELPTAKLLCNDTNGNPVEWGVIVAEENMAIDEPFNGNKAAFEMKKQETYETWSKVKDDDSISPYIATPSSWNPCASNLGTRKRRSTVKTSDTFTVGSEGDCAGSKNTYCNGELKPGRSYRAKSYVCTTTGCTETYYSEPIATEAVVLAPDPTIPIVAGAVSALVVLIVVGAVIFVLRRKQIACFSKDVESTHTHRAGNDINLDKIEPTRRNAFSPGAIKLADFPARVDEMHRDSDLLFADAYKLLKEKSPNHSMTAAEQQCCRPKNRYTNILSFDHSRVKLRPSDDIEGSDYINANYIPGYTSRREYIATQGPMQATFDDFWRMVWEQNVDTIVMLTKLMEKGRHKCDKYWPDLAEPVFYGDLVVSLQSESNLSDYTIKIFEVKMGTKMKKIKHFHFLQWPDFGCPDKHWPVINFISMVRQYRPHFPKGPLLVHCSAGVGRTGTYIAVDYLLQHIRDHDEVDIFNLVLDMRNHRLNMVQTEDQYVYIHECLKAFITTDEAEEDEDDEHVYVNTSFGAQEENIYENAGYQKD